MKPSGSTTSLTALDETGCIICSETDGGEMGEALIDSNTLTRCKCVFRVHRSCWEKYVFQTDEKLCPSCNKTVIPAVMLYPAISNERGYGRGNMSQQNWHVFYLILSIIFVIIIIVIGFQLNWFKKES